jgi:pimeloyl-ACP methyl ester carboxylesterase
MKPKLYFIPGTMCDERLWEDAWPLLQTSYHCVHLAIPMEPSIDAIIESLSEMLPSSGVNLIGFSLGGYLASQFACRYPQRLTTLIVLANSPTALPSYEITRREAVIRWVERQGYDGVPDRVINDQLHPNHKNNQPMLSKVKAMDATLGEQVLLQQLKATSTR